MNELKGKKLLILGGAYQHCKVVEAAREMGIITYVTDYLPIDKSPAKIMADHALMYNITEIDEMAEFCKKEGIDGVLSTHLDSCQLPYQKLCEKLGVPCFGNKEQFHILTDKAAFKQFCMEHGVDVIPRYTEEDIVADSSNVEFPILVKPAISRGSRGQTICYSMDEVQDAICFGKETSDNGEVIIEKYMGTKNDFSITVFVVDGKVYLERTSDRVLGYKEDKMDKSAIASVNPSLSIELYREKVHHKVVKMLGDLGIKYGPVFMQGFIDGDTVRFYDPGLRYPGMEYEVMASKAIGHNLIKPYIEFALTGGIKSDCSWLENSADVDGKNVCVLLIPLRPGTIASIDGVEEIKKHHNVVAFYTRYSAGDTVGEHYNVNQRFCEIGLLCDNRDVTKETVAWIYDTLKIRNTEGEDMVMSKLLPEMY